MSLPRPVVLAFLFVPLGATAAQETNPANNRTFLSGLMSSTTGKTPERSDDRRNVPQMATRNPPTPPSAASSSASTMP